MHYSQSKHTHSNECSTLAKELSFVLAFPFGLRDRYELTDPKLYGTPSVNYCISCGSVVHTHIIDNPLAWLMHKVLNILRVWGIVLLLCSNAAAHNLPYQINVSCLANAIYISEGGDKTRFPYGILTKYKHTTPRQACINTIMHQYKIWIDQGAKGSFIEFLGRTYSPPAINPYWVKNVTFYYNKLMKERAGK